MKNIFASVIIVVFFCSCEFEKEIDYRTVYDGDKLIVQGFISPQDGVRVIVKKTLPPNQIDGDDKVTNVKASIYEDDSKIAELKRIDDFLFVSDFLPVQGKKYSIRVQADGMKEVRSAAQLLMPATPVDSFKLVPARNSIVVFFTNNHRANNGYYLKIRVNEDSESDSYEFFSPFGTLSNIVQGFNAVENRIYSSKYDWIQVELFVLSADLTIFLESQKKYDASKDDPFFDRPYPVYSNIAGGYGIFGAYSVYRETIQPSH